jgi:hypothetical protein
MSVCSYCGDEIEFRYVGGVVIPIHINGGSCSGGRSSGSSSASALLRDYKKHDSYLDPNARCPVCGAPVFFYQSPYGGRVFFDDVGWPWPKHRCTDNWNGRNSEIGRPPIRFRTAFRSSADRTMRVLSLNRVVVDDAEKLRLLCKDPRGARDQGVYIGLEIKKTSLTAAGIDLSDMQEAPALIIPSDDGEDSEISFICARLGKVIMLPTRIILRK